MSKAGESTLEMPCASWLVPFLLLFVREQSSYGHDLTRRVADPGFGGCMGVVHRTLRRIEQEGLVLSERDGFDCVLPQRRYAIAGSAEAYLEFRAEHRKSLDPSLGAYTGEVVREEVHG